MITKTSQSIRRYSREDALSGLEAGLHGTVSWYGLGLKRDGVGRSFASHLLEFGFMAHLVVSSVVNLAFLISA